MHYWLRGMDAPVDILPKSDNSRPNIHQNQTMWASQLNNSRLGLIG